MADGELKATGVNFLEGMDTNVKRSHLPDGLAWALEVGDYLGYTVAEQFPIYFDGLGLYILVRNETDEMTEVQRLFKYLAVYCTHYDEDTVIGVRDLPDLLALYRILGPALMLRSEERFQTMAEDGAWARGKNWEAIYG
jgi:hypothetical protein